MVSKGLSNNQIFKLFEYSMIQIDYLIMSHVFEYVISIFFVILGRKRHLIKEIFLKTQFSVKFLHTMNIRTTSICSEHIPFWFIGVKTIIHRTHQA